VSSQVYTAHACVDEPHGSYSPPIRMPDSGSVDGPSKSRLASTCQPWTQTATMDSETNPAKVLFTESQRLGAFVHFWRRRCGPPNS